MQVLIDELTSLYRAGCLGWESFALSPFAHLTPMKPLAWHGYPSPLHNTNNETTGPFMKFLNGLQHTLYVRTHHRMHA
jgi:hypothetical protein